MYNQKCWEPFPIIAHCLTYTETMKINIWSLARVFFFNDDFISLFIQGWFWNLHLSFRYQSFERSSPLHESWDLYKVRWLKVPDLKGKINLFSWNRVSRFEREENWTVIMKDVLKTLYVWVYSEVVCVYK